MTELIRPARLRRLAAASVAAVAAMGVAACSTDSSGPAATTTVTATVSAPASTPATASPTAAPATSTPASSSTPVPASDCQVNPSTAPVPSVDPYGSVPEADRISVTLDGVSSGTVTAGGAPTEVGVKLCNNSPVDYPNVGVVFVLSHCSCAPNPVSIPSGTVERFDETSGSWVALDHAVAGTGMDFLNGYTNVRALPKGTSVTLRYRIALDASMTTGDGGVEVVAVTPDPLNQIGNADLSFAVVK